ncbi:MAG: hypothetical protein KJ072_25965 [Verrucomicrobia bacterium]|nr:hypothetical protein [Verrucomicrobiota bacterium]
MSVLTADTGVWEAAKPLILKWLREGVTEDEAWLLLDCFESVDHPETSRTPLPLGIRLLRTQSHPIKSNESLAVLAVHLHRCTGMVKDVRTIRRWCQAGRVPGAYQTPGGHWRVRLTPDTMRGLAERLGWSFRGSKNVLRSRRWKEFKRLMIPGLIERLRLVVDLDAELRHALAAERRTEARPKLRDTTLLKFLTISKEGGDRAIKYLALRLEARKLHLSGEAVTAAALAAKLAISRRTLFRRYGDGRVYEAIRQASKPLDPGEQTEAHTDADLDRQAIVRMTTSHEVQARPKPTVEAKDVRSRRHPKNR